MAQSYTVADLIQRVSQRIADWNSFITSAAGNAGGTYLTATALRERPADGWVPMYVQLTSGAASGDIRPTAKYEPVDDDVSDLSNLYVQTPFSAQVASAVTFRMHRFHPTLKIEAIDETLRNPRFLRSIPNIVSEDFPSGNLLRNGNFEYWLTTARPSDWETVGGTVTRNTSPYEGRYRLGLAATSSSVRQRIQVAWEIDQEVITFTCWVRGTVAAVSRLRLTVGDTDTDSSAHTGGGAWEQLSVSATITDPTRPTYATLVHNHATTVYFDAARLMLPIPSTNGSTLQEFGNFIPASEFYLHGFSKVQSGYFEQASVATSTGFGTKDRVIDYVEYGLPEFYERGYGFYPRKVLGSHSSARMVRNIGHSPPLGAGHWLRITGEGKYPIVSATTDAVELPSDEAADYLAVLAAQRLYQKASFYEMVAETNRWDGNVQKLEAEAVAMERDGIAIPRPIFAHSIFR